MEFIILQYFFMMSDTALNHQSKQPPFHHPRCTFISFLEIYTMHVYNKSCIIAIPYVFNKIDITYFDLISNTRSVKWLSSIDIISEAFGEI